MTTERELFEKWKDKHWSTQTEMMPFTVWQAAIQTYEQALIDPENQPSQFGTVPLEWYENIENKLERMRFKVGKVIDTLDGSYEKHAIRKALQEAIE